MGQEIAQRRRLFALKYHRNTKGKPLDLERFHFLQQPYADAADSIVMQTGTQTGKTEWLFCDAMALISLGLSYQTVQPKDELRAMFLKKRIVDPIKTTPAYQQYCQVNGNFVNWEGAGSLRVTFSNVPNEMIAFPADAVGVDEVDFCDLNNLALLPDRMMNSDFRIERRTSTPTVTGHAGLPNINFYYQESDQKVWVNPCPKCEHEQEITWEGNIVDEERDSTGELMGFRLRDADWSRGCGRDVRCFCENCGHPMDRLGPGRWFAMNPGAEASGYNLGKIPSPLVTITEMVSAYTKAQGNPVALQRFSNSYCGKTYQGAGDKITERLLLLNMQPDYAINADTHIYQKLQCSMGIDVNGASLDVRISDHPMPGVRRARFIGKVGWGDLPKLIEQFKVRLAVIDEHPERTKALEFQEAAKCRVVLCMERELNKKISPALEDIMEKGLPANAQIDRTIWMDLVRMSFVRRQNWLPYNYRTLCEGQYAKEMLQPTRVMEVDSSGNGKFVWTSGQDHSFHADVFDLVASTLGFQSGVLSASITVGGSPRMMQVAAFTELLSSESSDIFRMD